MADEAPPPGEETQNTEPLEPKVEPARDDSAWVTVKRFDLQTGGIDSRKKTQQGGLALTANMTRTGVFVYQNADGTTRRELRPADEVFDPESLKTLAHATFTIGHPDKVTPANWKKVAVGHVAGTPHKAGKYVQGEIHVQHGDAIDAVENGQVRELSCGYDCAIDPTPGVFDGPEGPEKYDVIQRRIRYNHVGGGPDGWGRAGPDVRLHLDGGDGESALVSLDGAPMPAKPAEGGRYVRATTMPDEDQKARTDGKITSLEEKIRGLTDANLLLQGKVDAFDSEKQKRADGEQRTADQARSDAAFDGMIETVDIARHHLGREWSWKREDGSRKDMTDIRVEIIKHLKPSIKLDSKEPMYIAGMCATLLQTAEEAEEGLRGMQDASHIDGGFSLTLRGDAKAKKGKNPFPPKDDDEDEGDDTATADAQAAMVARSKDAWQSNRKGDRNRRGDLRRGALPSGGALGGGNTGSGAGALGGEF